MALTPSSKSKNDADKTEQQGGDEAAAAAAAAAQQGNQGADLSDEVKAQLKQKDDEIASLRQQLEDQKGEHDEALQAEKEGRLKDSTERDNKIQQLQADLESAKAAAKPAKAAKAAPAKLMLVISKTDRTYLVENGIRVTPDVPVKAEWKEGNLLDANMKAGLIEEYEG